MRQAVVGQEVDPIAVDQLDDLIAGPALLDGRADLVELRDRARMGRRAIIDLRPVIPQQLALHRLLRGLDPLVPFAIFQPLLERQRKQDSRGDDRQLDRQLAPVLRRLGQMDMPGH